MGIHSYKRKDDCDHYGRCLFFAAKKDVSLKCSGCHEYVHHQPDPEGLEAFVFSNKEADTIVYSSCYDTEIEDVFLRG